MKNSLLSYMNKRFGEVAKKNHHTAQLPGPVITISREVGCGGSKIARKLANSLNEFIICKRWQVISKEVLQNSAKELKLEQHKVDRLFSQTEHSTFDEILEAFNVKTYKSDRVILKTVKDVIHGFAEDGCCIIIGRAGHFIVKDIEHALHVRLEAPLDWRIRKIASNKNISQKQAHSLIVKTEKARDAFRKHYMREGITNEHFDLVINVSNFEPNQIAQLVKAAVELKGITESFRSTVSYF